MYNNILIHKFRDTLYKRISSSLIIFSIFGTGGWPGLTHAYFSIAPRDSCNSIVDFPGRLRYRTHDDVRFATGKLSHRSEVGRAKRNGWHVQLILDHQTRFLESNVCGHGDIKLVVSGTNFQRHSDGPDEDTSLLDAFRVAALYEDDLSSKYNRRVGQPNRCKTIVCHIFCIKY